MDNSLVKILYWSWSGARTYFSALNFLLADCHFSLKGKTGNEREINSQRCKSLNLPFAFFRHH